MDDYSSGKLHEDRLLRFASKLNADATVPIHFPPATILFLRRLALTCRDPRKKVARFMLEHFWSLEDELLRLLLPQQFHDLCAQLNAAQESKEEAVVNQDWDTARVFVERTESLKQQMSRTVSSPINVEPTHIIQAMSILGFDEPVEL